MAGISDKAVKTQYAENKYRYDGGTELQNKEFSDGSGLELYETTFRSFDPQLGRFFQADPLADKFHSMTTYQYAGDNPVLSNDPTGSTFRPNVSHGQGGSNSYAEAQAIAAAIDQDDDNWSETYYVVSGGGGAGGDGGNGDNSCPLVGPSDSDNSGSNSTANSTDATGNSLDGVNPDDMAGGPTWENFGEAGGLGVAWSDDENSGIQTINVAPVMIYGESVKIDVNLSCTPYCQ